jgi:hypothetical protein
MFQRIRTLLFGRGKSELLRPSGKHLLPLIVDYGHAFEYPPMWRKEWDHKHAEKFAARTDPIDALNQSLKAAGIHPSQTDPVLLHERGDIFPHVEVPEPIPDFVKAMTPDEIRVFARRLAD